MEGTQRKSIIISGIEIKDNKVTLLEQSGAQKYPVKYSFFMKKQDGTTSKAYDQFEDMDIKAGDVVSIAVKETQGTNQMSGKPVTYRNVMFFYTDGKDAPTGINQQQIGIDPSRMDKMADWAVDMAREMAQTKQRLDAIDAEIAGLKDLLGAKGNPAYEVSKSLDTPIKKKIFTQPEIPVVDIDDLEEANMELGDSSDVVPHFNESVPF